MVPDSIPLRFIFLFKSCASWAPSSDSVCPTQLMKQTASGPLWTSSSDFDPHNETTKGSRPLWTSSSDFDPHNKTTKSSRPLWTSSCDFDPQTETTKGSHPVWNCGHRLVTLFYSNDFNDKKVPCPLYAPSTVFVLHNETTKVHVLNGHRLEQNLS